MRVSQWRPPRAGLCSGKRPPAPLAEDVRDPQDGGLGKVGYEINFNRYFYEYVPPRPLAEIEADIRDLEKEIVQMLGEITGSGDSARP